MLTVLPICQKDWQLMARNLEWLLSTGQTADHDALIAYDEALDQPALDAVKTLAGKWFRSVTFFRYDPPHSTEWPQAANHAWQSVIRYIYVKHKGEHWFWWEADATPLVPDWLNQLEAAYLKCGRDMAGHIVMGMGHMNGVAVYPWNTLELAVIAATTRQVAFDVALSTDCGDRQFPLNHLIYHFPRANGMRVTFIDKKALSDLKQAGYILFHGCTDGTLVDLLEGKEIPWIEVTNQVRFFSADDIGKPMDEAEHYWQKEVVRLEKKGWNCIYISQVRREVPSILDQTSWPTGFFELPTQRGICYMNPGLTCDGSGTLWMVVRNWLRRSPKQWHSELLACELTPSLGIRNVTPLKLTEDVFEQNEDARVIWKDGNFHVSYCSWNQRKIYHARQIFAVFNEKWELQSKHLVRYGWNDTSEMVAQPEQKIAEKNWVWFWHDDMWHFIYGFVPHIVIGVDNEFDPVAPYESTPPLPWCYGEIRGGTPPVRVGDEYLTFFHSSLNWDKKRKRYWMGAYCFEAKPPFAVTRITPEPLLTGSENDPRIHEGPLVVFPGGAVLRDGSWLVAFGVNDERCAWINIPHAELEGKMLSV